MKVKFWITAQGCYVRVCGGDKVLLNHDEGNKILNMLTLEQLEKYTDPIHVGVYEDKLADEIVKFAFSLDPMKSLDNPHPTKQPK